MNLSIILEKYSPSNPIHFKQLHYFSDNLNEKDQVLFIEQIFKVGGYIVGSEIGSKSSFESSKKTAFKLLENKFDEWQEETIDYLNRIPNPKFNSEKEAKDFILLFKSYSLFEFDNFLNKIEILGILISKKGLEDSFFEDKARKYFKNLFYQTLTFSKEITDDNYIIIFGKFLLILMSKEKLMYTLSALKIPFFENIAFSTKKNKLPHDIGNLLLDYSEKFINPKINKSGIYKSEFSEYLLIQLIIKKNSHDSFIKVSEKLNNYLNSLIEKPIHSSLELILNEIRFIVQLKRMGMQFDHETSTKIIIFLIEIFEFRIDKFVEDYILEEYSEGYYKIEYLDKLLKYFRTSQNCFYTLIPFLEKKDILKILYKIGSAIDHFSHLNEILKKDSHLKSFLNLEVYHFDENLTIRLDENGVLFKLNFQPFSEGYIYIKEFKTSTKPKEIAIHPNVIRRHFTKIKSIKFSPIDLNELFFLQRYKSNLLFFGFENFVITQLFHLIRLPQFSPFSLRGNYTQRLISFAGKIPPEIRSNYVLKLKPIEIRAFIKERWPQLYLDIESYLNENSETVYSQICAFHTNNTKVKSTVIYQSNQGFIVSTNGLLGFLPGSQVLKNKDLTKILGNKDLFDIEKTDDIYQSFVVSNKSSIEDKRNFVLSKIEKGQILEGTVKNIVPYGVFIDVGGIDGLIHITDLSWGRVTHPEEILKLDQKINVVILDFDDDKKRITLGFKQLQPHPWDSLGPNLNIGDKVSGKVLEIFDYGAFIELASGVEGLIHVSEMSWSQHLRSAQDFLAIGDPVEAVIIKLNFKEREMSLSIKELIPDPWSDIEGKYFVKSNYKGKVRNFTNFGFFVELEKGIDGLIHKSNLSWQKKFKHPSEFCKSGDEIQVVVLEIDLENRRIYLGHKQLQENPWDIFEATFADGSIHNGTIIEMKDKSGIVLLPGGFEGICPEQHMNKVDGSKAQVDETLAFKVLEYKKESMKIIVSHTCTFEEEENRPSSTVKPSETAKKSIAPKKVAASSSDQIVNQIKTTFGAFGVLSELKKKMENGEENNGIDKQ